MQKMPGVMQNTGMKIRILIVAAIFSAGCFGVLLARLWNIQIKDYEFYQSRAAGQQLRDSVVHAHRGDILDCNGLPMAVSATCWTIRAIPREMADEHVRPVAEALSRILDIEEEKLLKKLQDRKSNDKLIALRVTEEKAKQVRKLCAENGWQGIVLHEDSKRFYPEGDFAASILGFTNVDNDGLAGLELRYNNQLKGTDGRVLSAKNAWGYDLPRDYDTLLKPVKGNDLYLTVDRNIQHFLENHLSFAIKEFNVADRGAGIVMEVETGRVLALATKPDFDPNQPRIIANENVKAQVDALDQEQRSSALQAAQQAQWRNKAVSDLYEPGSVFKLITCAAALDTGSVTPQSHFYCGKAYRVAGIPFHCANHKSHGDQNLGQALANSCNQSFIQIGQALGKQNFCDYFERFGLRESTGIDLPAEPRKSEFYTADKMGPVELASCAFGQSSKITPIQMITAVSAVVNGGMLMRPYVVEKIVNSDGKIVRDIKPHEKHRVISEQTSAQMRKMMEAVVNGGTGRNGYVPGYRIGGKTGTSQKLDSENEQARIASFVGVAPIDKPRIAVLIILDEPHAFSNGGGALAAPVAARVIEDTLEYYKIPKEYTEDEKAKLFLPVPKVKSYSTQLAENILVNTGFVGKIIGEGEKVIEQWPEENVKMPRGSTVILYTETAEKLSVKVPDLSLESFQEASAALHRAGLNISADGTVQASRSIVLHQSAAPGHTLPPGSLVKVNLWDPYVPSDFNE